MGKGNHWISFSELLSLFLDRMVDLNQIFSMVGSAFSSRRGGRGEGFVDMLYPLMVFEKGIAG